MQTKWNFTDMDNALLVGATSSVCVINATFAVLERVCSLPFIHYPTSLIFRLQIFHRGLSFWQELTGISVLVTVVDSTHLDQPCQEIPTQIVHHPRIICAPYHAIYGGRPERPKLCADTRGAQAPESWMRMKWGVSWTQPTCWGGYRRYQDLRYLVDIMESVLW